MAKVYLGLGSNLGDRGANIQKALADLERWGIKILRSSGLYETEPVGLREQPWFYNAAAAAETALTPEETLKAVSAIELAAGRQRGVRNGPRKLDIDILLYDGLVKGAEELTIPHPRMHERNFVLVPLNEIAGDAFHPVLKKTVAEILKGCADKAIVRPLP